MWWLGGGGGTMGPREQQMWAWACVGDVKVRRTQRHCNSATQHPGLQRQQLGSEAPRLALTEHHTPPISLSPSFAPPEICIGDLCGIVWHAYLGEWRCTALDGNIGGPANGYCRQRIRSCDASSAPWDQWNRWNQWIVSDVGASTDQPPSCCCCLVLAAARCATAPGARCCWVARFRWSCGVEPSGGECKRQTRTKHQTAAAGGRQLALGTSRNSHTKVTCGPSSASRLGI